MANITQEIALLERQKKSAKTNRDKVDIMRKVKDLKEQLTKQQTQTTLPAARKVVKQMPNESFKELIARLKLKPEYAFLKNMGLGKIADDYRVVGKRVGWRVKGHHNYKVPSKKFRKDNPDLVYYEDRKNRSDVYRPDRLEQGGNTDSDVKGLREGQSYTWMKGGVEHTIYIDKIEGNSILFRLDGKYQKYSRKNFNEFIEQIGATPDYMAKGGAVKKSTFVLTNEKGEEIFRTTSLSRASDRRVMQPNKDNIKIDVIEPDGSRRNLLARGGEVGDNNSTIFDSLKKGDKINITYSSGISRTNEKKLQLRSKNIVGKGKSYESEKITFDNLDNPTGVKYYAYKRKDDSISFAMGDMAISQVVMTKEGVMATGGSVKNKRHFDLNSEGNFAAKINGKNYEIIYRDDKSKLYDLFENGKKIKSDKSVRDVMYFAEGGSVKKKRFEDGGEVKTGVEIMAAPKGHPEVEGNFLFPSNANKNTLGIKLAKGGGFNQYGEPYGFDNDDDDDDFSAYYWKETQDKNGKITGYDVIEKDSHQTVYQNRSKQKALEFIDRYKSGYAKGGEVAAIEVGDWVSEKKGTARGKVYEDTGSFIKLEDKYGGKSNTLYSKRQFKKSVKPRY